MQPSTQTQPRFASLLQKHSNIYVVVSPPRCSSTVLARVFWEHPSIRYYSHEPFETLYYLGEDLDSVFSTLEHPLDLQDIKMNQSVAHGDSLIIKEMPYQVGEHFPLLASLTTEPVIFLMRDPRLNIASRMAKKREVGDNPLFPLVESGWDLLSRQVRWCQQQEVPYVIVDATDFRNHPVNVFEHLFAKLHLDFSEQMLTWRSHHDVDIDNLEGQHRHLYRRALHSTTVEPALEPIPAIKDFPRENGFRKHVVHCLKIYETLCGDSARITI